ncbi:MAG: CatB-related O-acetyltransferase [Lachnospiraceae bacterium]|nr:CatB-related O-acetyltransferase [Lachnospiraceae bacterium]
MLPKSYVKDTVIEGKNYIGKNTVLKNCVLGFGSYVNNGSDLTDTDIGRYTSIGADVKTVIGKHPVREQAAMHPAFTAPEDTVGFSYVKEAVFDHRSERTSIGNDVWIGNGALIMGGVKIADGSVIGAGSVVTKDTQPYSISAGVPAKVLRYRFDPETIEKLTAVGWWNKGEDWIRENIERFKDAKELTK